MASKKAADGDDQRQYDLKFNLLLIGDSGVGKSSLILRCTGENFSQNYFQTIGMDYKQRLFDIHGHRIRLNIWDTAGQERFQAITTPFYRDAHGVMLIYDITRKDTYEHVESWKKKVDEHAPEDVVLMVIGNKCDMNLQRCVSKEEGQWLASRLHLPFHETSAKNRPSIEEAFEEMARLLKEKSDNNGFAHRASQATLKMTDKKPKSDDDSSCCG